MEDMNALKLKTQQQENQRGKQLKVVNIMLNDTLSKILGNFPEFKQSRQKELDAKLGKEG